MDSYGTKQSECCSWPAAKAERIDFDSQELEEEEVTYVDWCFMYKEGENVDLLYCQFASRYGGNCGMVLECMGDARNVKDHV